MTAEQARSLGFESQERKCETCGRVTIIWYTQRIKPDSREEMDAAFENWHDFNYPDCPEAPKRKRWFFHSQQISNPDNDVSDLPK